jgi:hypothetical protein
LHAKKKKKMKQFGKVQVEKWLPETKIDKNKQGVVGVRVFTKRLCRKTGRENMRFSINES